MALKNTVKNELWAISGASAMVLYHPIRRLLIVGSIFFTDPGVCGRESGRRVT